MFLTSFQNFVKLFRCFFAFTYKKACLTVLPFISTEADYQLPPSHTDADLFRHTWGEFDGQEGRLADCAHISQMTGMERMTFEDCTQAGPYVIAYGLNVPAVPYWKSVERLMTDTGCTAYQAETLLAQWANIDATRSMVNEFVKWIIDRGVEPAIQYFAMLVDELPELPSGLTEVEEHVCSGPAVSTQERSNIPSWFFDETSVIDLDLFEADIRTVYRLETPEPPASPVQGRKLYKTIDDGLNSLPPYLKGTDIIYNELLPWLSAAEFDRLYETIGSTTLVSELKEIGSWLFHNKVMQYEEGNDFWAVYRAKKKALHYTGRKAVARETYREILAFDKLSSLKRFGFNMHKALKGSVPELANLGYKIKSHLWDAYNKRKAELSKQPEVVEMQPEPPM